MEQKPRAIGAEAPAAHTREQDQPSQTPPPEQRAAGDPAIVSIGMLRPWVRPAELYFRQRLQNAAILSAARAVRARSERARRRFWEVNETANNYLFADADTDTLSQVVAALCRDFLSADTFERLEAGSGCAA